MALDDSYSGQDSLTLSGKIKFLALFRIQIIDINNILVTIRTFSTLKIKDRQTYCKSTKAFENPQSPESGRWRIFKSFFF